MATAADDDDALVMPEDVITGEAVALDLPPASFATRALAIAVDLMVMVAVLLAMAWLLTTLLGGIDEAAGAAIALVVGVSVLVFLPASWETLTRGRSPGKLAAGLRVVRDDGGPIRWRQALMRALLGVFEIVILAGSAALICSLWNPRGKRLGDLLAGTYVVRDRAPAAPPALPVPPPALAAWAAGADVGRLPDELALAARRFLGRAGAMHPESRARTATDLATRVSAHVAPTPPGPTAPEAFLAAVLTERGRRTAARLEAEHRRRLDRARRRSAAPVLSPGSTRLIEDPGSSGAPTTQR